MVWLPSGEKNFAYMFCRFDRIRACDRRTDWQTWSCNNVVKGETSALARHISGKRGGGAVTTVCNTLAPRPLFNGNIKHFRRSLHASIYSTQWIENDVSASLPNRTSASCDLDLWPPEPRGQPLMPLLREKIMPICIEIGSFVFEV